MKPLRIKIVRMFRRIEFLAGKTNGLLKSLSFSIPYAMKAFTVCHAVLLASLFLPVRVSAAQEEDSTLPADNAWLLAAQYRGVHRFSTLFTAQDVRRYLSQDSGIDDAVAWCRQTGVTKVYIESFRDGYQAERAALEHARLRFEKAGFEVAGCVTTTHVGKPSTGWNGITSCYNDGPTQEKLEDIFTYTAGLFDEIMIDDFWFTDCTCPDCTAAKDAGKVTIGDQTYPVAGHTWEDYRCELMLRLSQDRILTPARKVNPRVRVIIKYPQWYDNFHERGYDVARETALFDRIWVGTETRDYNDSRWGGTVQYEGYFIMRWLGRVGGEKCGGGWFDWLGTTEKTYLEQARQTILAGARESFLFCYGGLHGSTGPKDVQTLRANLPELFQVAAAVKERPIVGVAAYKPLSSHPEKEGRVFDFVGMLGLPLVPCYQFPTNSPAAFFSVHALKDPDFLAKLERFIAAGKPTLLTDGLVARLRDRLPARASNVQILEVHGDPKGLLQLDQATLDKLRAPLLRPFSRSFEAPNKVALYLFEDGSWVVENFNDQDAQVQLDGVSKVIPARGWLYHWQSLNKG